MEMGSVQPNHTGDFIEDTSVEQLFSPDSSDVYNVFGDPELLPRVGDLYQVEIPPLITEFEYILYKKNPMELDFAPGVRYDFLLGLPIPIMRINKEVEYAEHEQLQFLGDLNGISNKSGHLKSESNEGAQICSQVEDSKPKVEPVDIALENGTGSAELENLALEQEMKSKMYQMYRGEGYSLVPGSFGASWSDFEEASFLLGLYVFGKNFFLVKKFIENKTMGDILAFYYGKFYRSNEYRRWSDCRKMRSKRCVYGQRIFTGLRQQELLSRLFLHVSEECQTTLLEVSKTFGDGKMSLEEYVSTLKAIVGMNSLVEAVGIGKGKRDLTGITMEPLKSNNAVTMRPEIPIGKACSSLTPEEIIKFLTGDFRLSKARSNDLFWEAVWPRLLARGWHSEQPKDQGYAAGSKHSLVFLVPGVKKFSRRRLVKGNHYFDSVSDVLGKVALDPGLLELDNEGNESSRSKEECGWPTGTKLEHDDLSDRRRHCYLQPRTPNRSADVMKFTVVDTSLGGGKTFKVRELRTSPNIVSKATISRSHSEESDDENNSEVSSEDSGRVDTMLFDQEDTNNSNSAATVTLTEERDLKGGASNQGTKCPDSGNVSLNNCEDFNNLFEDKRPRKTLKSIRRQKQDGLNHLAPVTKRRRRLSSCARSETSHHPILRFSVSPTSEQDKRICCLETTDCSENNFSGKKVSSTSSSKGSPVQSSEGISCNTDLGAGGGPCDNPQPRTLIDLNLPQISPDFDTSEASVTELRNGQDDLTSKAENSVAAPRPTTADVTLSEQQQPNMNSRRQSTRNRPLTVKALEALAGGFLIASRKRKNKEACPREKSTARPPRHARGGMEVAENFGGGSISSQTVEVGNGMQDVNNSGMFGQLQEDVSEGNAAAQATGP